MRHQRHYTLDQATELLPWVSERLVAMREARKRLTDSETRAALAEASPGNGGGASGQKVGEAFLALRADASALDEREIVVRDLDSGLVDFPALHDDHEVYLCWIEGEEQISYWHELDAGYAGRQAL